MTDTRVFDIISRQMDKERGVGDFEANERLVIASKIRKLYETDPEDFDPETQLADAQDLVNTLETKINYYSKSFFKFTTSGEYTIGGFITKKVAGKYTDALNFKPYRDSNSMSHAFNHEPPRLIIGYAKRTKELEAIVFAIPKVRTLRFRLLNTDYIYRSISVKISDIVPVWTKKEEAGETWRLDVM